MNILLERNIIMIAILQMKHWGLTRGKLLAHIHSATEPEGQYLNLRFLTPKQSHSEPSF